MKDTGTDLLALRRDLTVEQLTVFYQAEGLTSIEVIEIERETSIADLRELLVKKHGWPAEIVVFAEDLDDELDPTVLVCEFESSAGTKLHAHRCRKVDVSVSYNGVALPYTYAPSATIVRIKHHAAIDGFHLTEEAAAEHVLQVKGTTTQPKPSTHVGALVRHPDCCIIFDLVPKHRVQGACEPIN
jgi:hypothetical protein